MEGEGGVKERRVMKDGQLENEESMHLANEGERKERGRQRGGGGGERERHDGEEGRTETRQGC